MGVNAVRNDFVFIEDRDVRAEGLHA